MSETETPDSAEESSDEAGFEFIADGDTLDAIVDPLAATDKEAVVEFSDDGFVAHTVGPANVLMAQVEAPSDAFEHYEGGGVTTGFPLEMYTDMATASDRAKTVWNGDGTITVESGPVDATIACIDPDTIETKTPTERVYNGITVEWSMPPSDLETALRATTKFARDSAQFHITPGDDGEEPGAALRKRGDGKEEVRSEFEHAEFDEEPPKPVVSKQAEQYLGYVRKAMPSGSSAPDDFTVDMYADTDWPVVFEWTHHGIDVTMVQAPRLDNQ